MSSREFSREIRRAAGHASADREVKRPVGDILGHRHGGTHSVLNPPAPAVSVSSVIRAARAARRERVRDLAVYFDDQARFWVG